MGTKQNPGTYDCYENAAPDEPMFVLLARDDQAPNLVRRWAAQREDAGGKPEKIAEARACADAMEAWKEGRQPVPQSAPGAHEQLRKLARFGAMIAHENLFDPTVNIDGESTEGHENNGRTDGDPYGFKTCPHPDCVLVRQGTGAPTCSACGADISLTHTCFPSLTITRTPLSLELRETIANNIEIGRRATSPASQEPSE